MGKIIVKENFYNGAKAKPLVVGKTLKEIRDENTELLLVNYTKVYLDGVHIPEKMLSKIKPKENAHVGVYVVPQGDDFWKAVGQFVIIAIGIYVGAYLGGGVLGALGTTAVSALGGALMNSIFPPPSLNSGLSDYKSPPTYAFNSTKNKSRLGQTVKRPYGRFRYAPDFAALPYTMNVDDTQDLYMLFDFGEGDVDVENIRIGNNLITYYKDLDYRVHQDVKVPFLEIYKGDRTVDALSLKAKQGVEQIISTDIDTDAATLEISFPTGLYWVDDETGDMKSKGVNYTLQYRENGTDDWLIPLVVKNTPTNLNEYSVAYLEAELAKDVEACEGLFLCEAGKKLLNEKALESMIADGFSTNFNVEILGKDDYVEGIKLVTKGDLYLDIISERDMLTGTFIEIPGTGIVFTANPIYAGIQTKIKIDEKLRSTLYIRDLYPYEVLAYSAASDYGYFNDKNVNPLKRSLEIKFPTSGKYDIRFVRLTKDNDGSRYVHDDMVLTQLQSIKNTDPVIFDAPHTVLEIRIRATEQLNGIISELTAYCSTHIDVFDYAFNKVRRFSNNPAHVVYDLFKRCSIPVPDARINVQSFLDFERHCDTVKQMTFNGELSNYHYGQFDGVIDDGSTLLQVVSSILSSNYASLSSIDGQYTIIIDAPVERAKQLLTPRNTFDFSGSKVFQPLPLKIRVSFIDPANDWQPSTLDIDAPAGMETTDKIETVDTFGITTPIHALLYGKYVYAQLMGRSETFVVSTDFENLISTRGDVIELQHDVPKIGGVSGRIKALTGNTITIDEQITGDLNFVDFDYIIKVRTYDGQVKFAEVVEKIDLYTVRVLIMPIDIEIGDLVTIGEKDTVTDTFRISAIKPKGKNAEIELIPYRNNFYSFYDGIVLEYNPVIDNGTSFGGGDAVNVVHGYDGGDNGGKTDDESPSDLGLNWPTGGNIFDKDNGDWIGDYPSIYDGDTYDNVEDDYVSPPDLPVNPKFPFEHSVSINPARHNIFEAGVYLGTEFNFTWSADTYPNGTVFDIYITPRDSAPAGTASHTEYGIMGTSFSKFMPVPAAKITLMSDGTYKETAYIYSVYWDVRVIARGYLT
jgi:hypothetical protein